MAAQGSIPSRSRRPKKYASPPAKPRAVTPKIRIHGEKSDGLQNPAHGRVLWFAARIQDPLRRTLGSSRLPARGGRSDQRGRLPRAPAGKGPQGSDRDRLAQIAGQSQRRRYGGRGTP